MEILASFISRFLSPAEVMCSTLLWFQCAGASSLDVFTQAGVSLSSLLPAPESTGERRTLHLVFSNPGKSTLASEHNQGARAREEGALQKRQGEPDGMT